MKVLCYGSLNLDYVYMVDHIVTPGETISSQKLEVFAGGKGLNQSIALARAGMEVYLAGSVGKDGELLLQTCQESGIRTDYIRKLPECSGNAIIQVDRNGQNSILLYPGTNRMQSKEYIDQVLSNFHAGDVILLQNEINLIDYLMEKASQKGMIIVLNPSPYDNSVLELDLDKVSYLLINEIEGQMISGKTDPDDILPSLLNRYRKVKIVLTLGGKGVKYIDCDKKYECEAYQAKVVDTTGAGDTFTGYFLRWLLSGHDVEEALDIASLAASISVTRKGAAVSIPYLDEVIQAKEKCR